MCAFNTAVGSNPSLSATLPSGFSNLSGSFGTFLENLAQFAANRAVSSRKLKFRPIPESLMRTQANSRAVCANMIEMVLKNRLHSSLTAKAADGEQLMSGELVTPQRVRVNGLSRLDGGTILTSSSLQFARGFAVTT